MPSGDIKIYQSSLFGRKAKRLRKREKDLLDSEIKRILEDPDIGQRRRVSCEGSACTSSKYISS